MTVKGNLVPTAEEQFAEKGHCSVRPLMSHHTGTYGDESLRVGFGFGGQYEVLYKGRTVVYEFEDLTRDAIEIIEGELV